MYWKRNSLGPFIPVFLLVNFDLPLGFLNGFSCRWGWFATQSVFVGGCPRIAWRENFREPMENILANWVPVNTKSLLVSIGANNALLVKWTGWWLVYHLSSLPVANWPNKPFYDSTKQFEKDTYDWSPAVFPDVFQMQPGPNHWIPDTIKGSIAGVQGPFATRLIQGCLSKFPRWPKDRENVNDNQEDG